MTDFRALCAELVHLNEVEVDDWTRKWADAVKRTKAALAEGGGVEVSDGTVPAYLFTLAIKALREARDPVAEWNLYEGATLAEGTGVGPTDEELDALAGKHLEWTLTGHRAFARAVLARYGTHPRPIPVAERLPTAADCDSEGRCWIFDDGDAVTAPSWRFDNKSGLEELKRLEDEGKLIGLCQHWNVVWLPAAAIPLPEGEP